MEGCICRYYFTSCISISVLSGWVNSNLTAISLLIGIIGSASNIQFMQFTCISQLLGLPMKVLDSQLQIKWSHQTEGCIKKHLLHSSCNNGDSKKNYWGWSYLKRQKFKICQTSHNVLMNGRKWAQEIDSANAFHIEIIQFQNCKNKYQFRTNHKL